MSKSLVPTDRQATTQVSNGRRSSWQSPGINLLAISWQSPGNLLAREALFLACCWGGPALAGRGAKSIPGKVAAAMAAAMAVAVTVAARAEMKATARGAEAREAAAMAAGMGAVMEAAVMEAVAKVEGTGRWRGEGGGGLGGYRCGC